MLGQSDKSRQREIVAQTRVPVQTVGFVDDTQVVWRVMQPVANSTDDWVITHLSASKENARVQHLPDDAAIVQVQVEEGRRYSFEETVTQLGVWEYTQMRKGMAVAEGHEEATLGGRHFKYLVHARGMMIDAYGKLARTEAGIPVRSGTYRLEDVQGASQQRASVLVSAGQNLPALPKKQNWLVGIWQQYTRPKAEHRELLTNLKLTNDKWSVMEPFLAEHHSKLQRDIIAPEMRQVFGRAAQKKLQDIEAGYAKGYAELRDLRGHALWSVGATIATFGPFLSGLAWWVAWGAGIGAVSDAFEASKAFAKASRKERAFVDVFLTASVLENGFSAEAHKKRRHKGVSGKVSRLRAKQHKPRRS